MINDYFSMGYKVKKIQLPYLPRGTKQSLTELLFQPINVRILGWLNIYAIDFLWIEKKIQSCKEDFF